MSSSHSPDLSAASLYCGEDAGDWDTDTLISSDHPSSSSLSSLIYDSPPSDEITIFDRLIDSESAHMPHFDYLQRCRDRSVDITARQDSINWILKVREFYNFRPVTAILSVNYLDRFISTQTLPQENNGWPFQLLSVACLSLAAKLEEPQVPLLLNLQVSGPKYIFDPKTVQRMELWVMSNLNWRLRSVTPFDFIHCFISNSKLSGSKPGFFNRVFSASSDLILSTTRVIDFLGFPPSAIAAAAVISVAGETYDLPASFYEKLNKEMVRSCQQLMEEYLIDTCPSSVSPAPASPVGVLDAAACRSCDTQKSAGGAETGISSSEVEPPSKRLRSSTTDVQQQ